MQVTSLPPSVWQQLKQQRISCEQAIELLVDAQGNVELDRLDREVSLRFWRKFSDRDLVPPIIPLLLWRNCYYLGTPVTLTAQVVQYLGDRLGTEIQVIPITEKSYRYWHRLRSLDTNRINAISNTNPITGELENENITEIAELHLSQADNQIERIKTLVSSALRNRASDIHLAPSPEGLQVRFRIDGILRHVTTLPPIVSRKVIVSLKVMCDMDIADSRRPQDGRIGETLRCRPGRTGARYSSQYAALHQRHQRRTGRESSDAIVAAAKILLPKLPIWGSRHRR